MAKNGVLHFTQLFRFKWGDACSYNFCILLHHTIPTYYFSSLFQLTTSPHYFTTLFQFTISAHNFNTLFQHTIPAHNFSSLFLTKQNQVMNCSPSRTTRCNVMVHSEIISINDDFNVMIQLLNHQYNISNSLICFVNAFYQFEISFVKNQFKFNK